MLNNSGCGGQLLAFLLVGMSLAMLIFSKSLGIFEAILRWKSNRKIAVINKEIDKAKGELNAIHKDNVSNLAEYERLKREREKSKRWYLFNTKATIRYL